MNQDLKVRHFSDVPEVQRESLVALNGISVVDIRQNFQQWKWRLDRCTQSQWDHFEGGLKV
jgi:hypothetical protein